jgi:predicted nucleic acid-binding protein
MKFYVDTCVWIDLLDSKEKDVMKLFSLIIENKHTILLSNTLRKELRKILVRKNSNLLFELFPIEYIEETIVQLQEGKKLEKILNIPFADAVHAINARDNNSILITKDKHFQKLKSIKTSYSPSLAIKLLS